MIVYQFQGHVPAVDPTARVAENAVLAGQVTLAAKVNIWYGAVLRGDMASITIGEGSNVQDGAVFHGGLGYPVRVGRSVTVGHRAVVHGCTVEDGCLVGMGSILMNGCVIGAGSLIAAGALVTQNTVIPPGSLVMGAPGRVVRTLEEQEVKNLLRSAERYRALAAEELPVWSGMGEGC